MLQSVIKLLYRRGACVGCGYGLSKPGGVGWGEEGEAVPLQVPIHSVTLQTAIRFLPSEAAIESGGLCIETLWH